MRHRSSTSALLLSVAATLVLLALALPREAFATVDVPVRILTCGGSAVADATITVDHKRDGEVVFHTFLYANSAGDALIRLGKVEDGDELHIYFQTPFSAVPDHTILQWNGIPTPGEWGVLYPQPFDCGDFYSSQVGRWLLHYNP